mgnify:CR=1 FL=1
MRQSPDPDYWNDKTGPTATSSSKAQGNPVTRQPRQPLKGHQLTASPDAELGSSTI